MRIVAGKFKGRNIVAPASLPSRPTTSYAKSGIFNILNNHFHFEDLKVLDLFCGTGSISFEFASRGTTDILCVDSHAKCIKFVNEYAAGIGAEGLRAVRADVFRFIDKVSEKYDVIFADPPFEMDRTDLIPDLIFQKKMLTPSGWLIVEHFNRRILKSDLKPDEIRIYGNCAFSIFKNHEA